MGLVLDTDKGEMRYNGKPFVFWIPNSCGEVLLMYLEELIRKAWTKPANTVERHRVEIQAREYILFIRRRYAGIRFVQSTTLDEALSEA